MKAKLIKKEDGYNLAIEQPQGRLLEATCSPSEQLRLDKSRVSTKYKISKQNCDELFGVFDVNKLAEEDCSIHHPYHPVHDQTTRATFIRGFNKAMELNKDKVFTLEDIDKAYWAGMKFVGEDKGSYKEFIQSLQQPTEIEVMIVMECDGIQTGLCSEDCDCNVFLKLDSEGCLILKKI